MDTGQQKPTTEITEEEISFFMTACKKGNVDSLIQSYNRHGLAIIQATDTTHNSSENTALFWAATYNREKCVEFLLLHKVDLETKNSEGFTALTNACRNNSVACTKRLLEAGADITCRTNDNMTPLLHAACAGSAGCTEELLKKGADTETHQYSWTPLIYASANGHTEAVKCLLKYGADIYAAAPDGETALSLATKYERNEELLNILEEALRQKQQLIGNAAAADIHKGIYTPLSLSVPRLNLKRPAKTTGMQPR